MIDSVYRKDKNYYPQVLLEEWKYVVKGKKTSKFIIDNIEISSDDSDKEVSDEENSDEEFPMKKIKYRIFFVKNIMNFLNFWGFASCKFASFFLEKL